MAKNSVGDWDATADNNGDVGGVNIAEDCPAKGINNAIRTLMAQIVAAFATVAQIWSAATFKFTTPATLFTASEPQPVTYGATITLDGNAGWSFNIAALTGNTVLANPTNFKKGQSGRIRVVQDATGGRTMTYGSSWKFPGGAPVLPAGANAIATIAYFVNDVTGGVPDIEANMAKGYA